MIMISAIICTRNRSHYLSKAIDSLCKQSLALNEYEIIVVDNASTDDTKDIVCEIQQKALNLVYVYESEPGLSSARNTGWRNARGKYVAYLDDDAIASPKWLEEIINAFEKTDPRPACVGGKILPLWEIEKPYWFPKQFLKSLTILDYGETPIFLNDDRIVAGANIAFRKDLLAEIGGFDKRFTNYSDEVFVLERIRKLGMQILYCPNACVEHLIPKERLTEQYICRRKYLGGKGEFLMLLERKQKSLGRLWFIAKNLLGRPFDMLRHSILWIVYRSKQDYQKSIIYKVYFYRSMGFLIQSCNSRLFGKSFL